MVVIGVLRRAVALFAIVGLLAVFTAPRAGAAREQAPVVGPERPVSDPIEGPVDGAPFGAGMASDGTNHLVVWSEGRSVVPGYDVFGARVTPQGQVLDPVGIHIATGSGTQEQPRVAFGDGNFLVVWASFGPGELADVQGARVSPAGTVLDPTPIPISTAPGDQLDVSVDHGDGAFLVAWADTRSGPWLNDVYGSRVTDAGAVLDPEGIPISTAPENQSRPAVAYGAGSFLVVWSDGRNLDTADVYGARVDLAGAVLDPQGIPIGTGPSYQGPPAVAFNGSDHLVTWQEYVPPGYRVFAARVDPTGIVLDPTPIIVSPVGEGPFSEPAVTALGSTFLVAWQANPGPAESGELGARIDADGNNLDPVPIVISPYAGQNGGISVASDGSAYFAAWLDTRIGRTQVYGAPISADGSAIGSATLISRAANAQRDSDIAFDGTNHLVAWSDRRAGGYLSYATLMSPSGERLRSDIPAGGSSPTVAFDGDFVIGTIAINNVVLFRVDTSGDAVGEPTFLPPPQDSQSLVGFDIAANDQGVLVTWWDASRGRSTVRAVRVARDGTVLDPVPIVIGSGGGGVAVASDGRDFLVSWLHFDGAVRSVRATRVTADGTVLDPGGIPVTTGSDYFGTDVAWNGRRYLVVWPGTATDGGHDVLGARVTTAGVVEDAVPIAVTTAPVDQGEPVVAANGGTFLVAWRETDEEVRNDVRGARVADDGAVLDAPSFPIATSGEPEYGIALSPSTCSGWAGTYTRFVPESPFGADRVFLRSIAPK